MEDLTEIKKEARELDQLLPSPETWSKISMDLARRPLIQPAPFGHKIRLSFALGPSGWRFAFGTALLVVVFVAVFFGVRSWKSTDLVHSPKNQEYVLSKLEEAEMYYQKAILSLAEAAASQEKKIDPKVMDVFRTNLEIINASISACKQAVMSDPRDIDSRNYLLAVYKQKMDLLAEMVSLRGEISPSTDTTM
jgi:hypothetical protein